MHGRGAKLLECYQVLAHRVALVLREPVAGMLGVELAHQGIASGLGENRCRGNGQTLGVTLDDGLLGCTQVAEAPRVEEEVLRRQGETFDRTAHGEQTGPAD